MTQAWPGNTLSQPPSGDCTPRQGLCRPQSQAYVSPPCPQTSQLLPLTHLAHVFGSSSLSGRETGCPLYGGKTELEK